MAFFNGSGGAGDATTDSTSQAIAAVEAAAQAAASATAADASATAAAASAAASAASASTASSAADSALTQASNAFTYANEANSYLTQVTEQATLADSYAVEASTSASSASGYADLAQDWAIKTSSAVSGGEYSAKYHANAAATSASDAADSASNAYTSEINAAQSAIDAASIIPSQTGNSGKFLTTDGTDVSWATVSGTGTVTSVDMSVPTGLAISGNPVTTSGTLALTYASGYSIPTTTKQTNWDTAYGWGNHASAGYLTSVSTLDNLGDVVITSPSNGQVLKFNGTNWINDTDATSSGGGSGTVTSVALTVPTGLTVTGSPITTSGTFAVSLTSGYSIPTTSSQSNWDTAYGWGNHASAGYLTSYTETDPVFTASAAFGITSTDKTNWNTAYTDRNKWDGGATGLVAATGRTSLGATTVGSNLFTLTNPSAITFPRFNADNTVSALDAATFRTAIGAGTGSGTVTSVAALTLGTTGTDLSSTVATGTSTPVITLNVPTASASNRGALSSTDWSTFNNKQAALVSGTNIKTVNSNSLLGSGNISVGTVTSITAGTGLSGGIITGTGTIAIDSTVATLTGSQTLTNKTLTDPVITGAILEDVYTITDGAAFEIDPSNGTIQLITLGASRTPKATNFAAGESVTLMVLDGTAYTLTWTDTTFGTSGVTWVGGSAPTLDTTKYTVIELWKVGTTIYGALVGAA